MYVLCSIMLLTAASTSIISEEETINRYCTRYLKGLTFFKYLCRYRYVFEKQDYEVPQHTTTT